MGRTQFHGTLTIGLSLVCCIIIGCQSLGYYGQAIHGQLDLLNRRQPVADLIADPQTPHFLKDRLRLTTEILEFAETELLLPAGGQYRTYVSLDRSHVIWNVFAAPEFSLDLKTWCYPVVGCTTYRGYFNEETARRYAQVLVGQGYDVMVGGVSAYSTLGWFNDPLLSTFIESSEPRLAALIFHELAHQLLYVRDDSTFNESFATAVAHEGLRRWFTDRNQPAQYRSYLAFYHQQQAMIALISGYRSRLMNLYQSQAPAGAMRGQKESLLQALRQEYESSLKKEKTLAVFSDWFDDSLNNAKIASIATYHDYVPALGQLLDNTGNDLELFYRQCRRLAEYPANERLDHLKQLTAESAATGK